MMARGGYGRGAFRVRNGPAAKPRITRQATIGAHTGHRKSHQFQQPSAPRPPDIAALTLRTTSSHLLTPRPIPDHSAITLVRRPALRLFTFVHFHRRTILFLGTCRS